MDNENTIFNLPTDFLDTLSADELAQLKNAHTTMASIESRYDQWNGKADLKAHIEAVGAKARAEQEHADYMRNRFK